MSVPKVNPSRAARILAGSLSYLARNRDAPIVAWAQGPRVRHNWGDALNPVLVEKLSGKAPVWAGEVVNVLRRPIYYVIGSGLGNLRRADCEVWGTGFINDSARVLTAPRKIHAVRGPLSRQKYLSSGIDCPEIFGDPALLWPRFYSPGAPRQRSRVGVVPHIKDAHLPWMQELESDPDVRLIDICGGIERVVDEIAACDVVLSSTLHGLIVADAYGTPSTWVRFEGEDPGRWFKYRDHMLSVGRPERSPFFLRGTQSLEEASDLAFRAPIELDTDRLWQACPFRREAGR